VRPQSARLGGPGVASSPSCASRSLAREVLLVPGESVEGDDYIVPDACFAGQPTVSFKPGEIGRGYRSHRQTGTMMIALWVDLWKSSKAL